MRYPQPVVPTLATAAVLALSLVVAGCGGDAEPPAPAGSAAAVAEPERVESPELGIALVGARAAGFAVAEHAGGRLELERPAGDTGGAATAIYAVGPPQVAGVNLVEAVNERKAELEARPGGSFLGQVQLMSQLGNAYSTRGRYRGDDGAEVEEIKLFAVHPRDDRLLSVTYRYPAQPGGTQERMDEAMTALGLIEPLDAPPEPAAADEDAAAPAADAGAAGGGA